MAQKANKQLASRNASILQRLHLISAGMHGVFILVRMVLFRQSVTRSSIMLYIVLGLVIGGGIELWFERQSRPQYGAAGEVRRPGADLDARGATEFLFDVLYWTWAVMLAVVCFGDRAWWLWAVVPPYALYLLASAAGQLRGGLANMAGMDAGGASAGASADGSGMSNRQKKLERRGDQKVRYQH